MMVLLGMGAAYLLVASIFGGVYLNVCGDEDLSASVGFGIAWPIWTIFGIGAAVAGLVFFVVAAPGWLVAKLRGKV